MNGWPPNHVERLSALWSEGSSCSQIAKLLAGEFGDARYTRNAVIGKASRLGLPGRAAPSLPKRRYVHSREELKTAGAAAYLAPAAPRPISPPPKRAEGVEKRDTVEAAFEMSPVPEHNEAPGACTILTLGVHMCRWPIGDPRSESFTLCGKRRGDGSYCDEHRKLSVQPGSATNGKRGSRMGDDLTRALRRYL